MDDYEYNEYMERLKSEMTQRYGRFEPIEDQKKPAGNSEIPKNSYQMQGLKKSNSTIGADSIGSVRTLRNNLKEMQLKHINNDQKVRANLCDSACQQLNEVEKKLIAMNEQRSNAIFEGNTIKAKNVGEEMQQLAEDTIKQTYSDLLIDDKQMKAVGIDSDWTPDKRTPVRDDWRPITPLPARKREDSRPSTRSQSTSRPSTRSSKITSKEPPKMESRPVSRKSSKNDKQPSRPSTTASKSEPRVTKKNQRLSDILKEANESEKNLEDDPFALPTYKSKCEHCQQVEEGLIKPGGAESHYARSCKVMTNCKFCLKVVMIRQLTDHYINRCQFLTGRMIKCSSCGLSIDKDDKTHPMCRTRQPPSGSVWCPLCSVAVNDTNEEWLDHLTSKCYNNPRRYGPERDPKELKQEQDAIIKAQRKAQREEEERRQRRLEEEAERKREIEEQQRIAQMQQYPGRMIDADKLVIALQEIQERKKKEKKQNLKE